MNLNLQLALWLLLIVTPSAITAWALWQWSSHFPLGRVIKMLSLSFAALSVASLVIFVYAAYLIFTARANGEEVRATSLYSAMNLARQIARIVVDVFVAPLVFFAAIRLRRMDAQLRARLMEDHKAILRLNRRLEHDDSHRRDAA